MHLLMKVIGLSRYGWAGIILTQKDRLQILKLLRCKSSQTNMQIFSSVVFVYDQGVTIPLIRLVFVYVFLLLFTCNNDLVSFKFYWHFVKSNLYWLV